MIAGKSRVHKLQPPLFIAIYFKEMRGKAKIINVWLSLGTSVAADSEAADDRAISGYASRLPFIQESRNTARCRFDQAQEFPRTVICP
jgi:hypothetical protein